MSIKGQTHIPGIPTEQDIKDDRTAFDTTLRDAREAAAAGIGLTVRLSPGAVALIVETDFIEGENLARGLGYWFPKDDYALSGWVSTLANRYIETERADDAERAAFRKFRP